MPNIGLEAGIVLLFLLPGFISSTLVRSFGFKRKQTDFESVIQALVHTFIISVLYGVILRRLPVHILSTTQNNVTHYNLEVAPWSLAALLLIALAWGTLLVICQNKDVPWTWLRDKNLIHVSVWGSVWHDSFYRNADKAYAQVELADGRAVIGYVRHYSESSSKPCLFLEDAAWLGTETETPRSVVEIPGPGIILTKASGIVSVSFLNPTIKIEEPKQVPNVAADRSHEDEQLVRTTS